MKYFEERFHSLSFPEGIMSFCKLIKGATKLFLCPPQKSAKTQPTFQTAVFYDKFALYHIKPNIYI